MKLAYTGYDKTGNVAAGVIEAATRDDAAEMLRRQGVYVDPAALKDHDPAAGAAGARARSRGARPGRNRLRNLMSFTRQLHVLVQSGITLVNALYSIERQTPPGHWKRVVTAIRTRVEEGTPLSLAMAEHPQCFDDICRSLVAAGEASGRLEPMLDRIARLVRRQVHVRSSVVGALIYPCLLVMISLTVLVILLLFVLPRFTALFKSLGTPLPPTTQALMAVSYALQAYWWAALSAVAVAATSLKLWLRTPSSKRTLDRAVLRLPLVGRLVRSFVTARITRLLALQLEGSVPLLDALRLTRAAAGNALYADLIGRAEDAAIRGQPISSAFAESSGGAAPGASLVHPTVVEAIRSGEQSGRTAQMLLNVSDFLDDENEVILRSLTSILEPVILIVLGIIVGFVAVSMFLPLFDLTAATGGGG